MSGGLLYGKTGVRKPFGVRVKKEQDGRQKDRQTYNSALLSSIGKARKAEGWDRGFLESLGVNPEEKSWGRRDQAGYWEENGRGQKAPSWDSRRMDN